MATSTASAYATRFNTGTHVTGFLPSHLLTNGAWIAQWEEEAARAGTDETLLFVHITLPTGGSEYRPLPRFTRLPDGVPGEDYPLYSRTVREGGKPTYRQVLPAPAPRGRQGKATPSTPTTPPAPVVKVLGITTNGPTGPLALEYRPVATTAPVAPEDTAPPAPPAWTRLLPSLLPSTETALEGPQGPPAPATALAPVEGTDGAQEGTEEAQEAVPVHYVKDGRKYRPAVEGDAGPFFTREGAGRKARYLKVG